MCDSGAHQTPCSDFSHDSFGVSAGVGALLSAGEGTDHPVGVVGGRSRSYKSWILFAVPFTQGRKIAGDCSLIFSLELEENGTLAQSSLCPEKGRLFPCLNLVSRKSREEGGTTAVSGHQSHGGCVWGDLADSWDRLSDGKQGSLSGLPGGLADGRTLESQGVSREGGACSVLSGGQGWEGSGQRTREPAVRKRSGVRARVSSGGSL